MSTAIPERRPPALYLHQKLNNSVTSFHSFQSSDSDHIYDPTFERQDASTTVSAAVSAAAPVVEDDMSEKQLRELYDNEEIDRFLHLFSAYVTEVRLPETPANEKKTKQTQRSQIPVASTHREQEIVDRENTTPIGDAINPDFVKTQVLPQTSNWSLSQAIALEFLVPMLPRARPPPPAFTYGRLRVTLQRLYLAAQPAYLPFFIRLTRLAAWKDRRTSLVYCSIFWILWYHNLLLPCFLLRIFYALIRRKLLQYPTLTELRNHRREVTQANEFGDQISAKLLASSSFGMKELWRLFKVYNKTAKIPVGGSAKEKVRDKGPMALVDIENDTDGVPEAEDVTSSDDSQEAKDLRCLGLQLMNELADLHERITNIFIWRRPASSRLYGVAIFGIFLIALLLPAKFLAKLSYFVGGVFFWHVTPIIAALSPSERARLPAPLSDVPTDADYAMELISKRVAAGLDIAPIKSKKIHKKDSRANANNHASSRKQDPGSYERRVSEDKDRLVDWKKWGDLAATSKSEGKRLLGPLQNGGTLPPRSPFVAGTTVSRENSHTFPAQHTSTPGLVTVTTTSLLFTPLMSMNPKFVIPLNDIRGVKKTGLLKGLYVRSVGSQDNGERIEREEKFIWVGGRDELFARLIGTDGKRWLNV